MSKMADFIYELNKTRSTVKKAYFEADWDGMVVNARLKVNYKTEVRLGILPEEIAKTEPKDLAMEVALKMDAEYKEQIAMPLLERL